MGKDAGGWLWPSESVEVCASFFFLVHLDYFIIFSVALFFCCVCEYRFVISVYFLFLIDVIC